MDNHYIGEIAAAVAREHVGVVQGDARRIAERMGVRWALPALEKAAVGAVPVAISVDSGTGVQLTGVIEQMRSSSFAVMAAGLAPSYPLHAGLLQLDEVSPTAEEVDEGQPAPLGSIAHGVVLQSPSKIVYLTPMSRELLASAQAVDILERRARDAVSRGLDAALISRIGSSGGNISAGSDALADVRSLVGLINVTGSQPIIVGMSPDVALLAATLRQGGVIPFPAAVATGRSEIAGLPAMSTDRVAAGSMIALDASGIAINIEAIEVGASRNGAFAMSTGPSMPAQMVSAFQAGMVVVRVIARFAMTVIRQQDVAGELAGIAWANS